MKRGGGMARPDHRDADYSDETSTFGDRVAAAREALGLGGDELALRLGVGPEVVADWEEDRDEPRANKLQMLAGVLNVPIIWLMSGEGEGPVPPAGPAGNAGARAGEIASILAEIRSVREAQLQLGTRLQKLERRLSALLR
jgi:transcriptional regulator with XRE-family HTH domain